MFPDPIELSPARERHERVARRLADEAGWSPRSRQVGRSPDLGAARRAVGRRLMALGARLAAEPTQRPRPRPLTAGPGGTMGR
jgi:hypothetical protein